MYGSPERLPRNLQPDPRWRTRFNNQKALRLDQGGGLVDSNSPHYWGREATSGGSSTVQFDEVAEAVLVAVEADLADEAVRDPIGQRDKFALAAADDGPTEERFAIGGVAQLVAGVDKQDPPTRSEHREHRLSQSPGLLVVQLVEEGGRVHDVEAAELNEPRQERPHRRLHSLDAVFAEACVDVLQRAAVFVHNHELLELPTRRDCRQVDLKEPSGADDQYVGMSVRPGFVDALGEDRPARAEASDQVDLGGVFGDALSGDRRPLHLA